MIKIFSPENFNDYDDENAYGCIFQTRDTIYSLNVEDFTTAIELEYPSLLNNSWPDVTTFLQDMVELNCLSAGSGIYEITNYDQLIEHLYSWYDIPTDVNKIKDNNSYIDCPAFENYVTQNEEIFDDAVDVHTALANLTTGSGGNVIDNWSNKARIRDISKFRAALKDMLKTPSEQKVTELMNDTETGITLVNKMPLIKYIFEMTSDYIPEWDMLNKGTTYLDHQGNEVDLSPYEGIIKEDIIPGYEFFGIFCRKADNWYLDYDKLEAAVTALSADKYIAVTPQQFLNEQVSKNLIKILTDGVTYRYRIINIDIFRTNYSMYRIGINVSDKATNGDMVLMPTSGELDVEINGAWSVTIDHPYDMEGRSTYIQKGSVISLPIKVAREQTYPNQLFRVYDVQNNFNGVEIVGYPVAQESAFECAVDAIYLENKTPKEVASILTGKYPEKYLIETDLNDDRAYIYAQNSNLQEIIAGTDEATFLNAFGGEIIYDNYIYRIKKQAGRKIEDSKDYMINYKANMTGITINENTFDVITRIYPTSEEGYNFDSVMASYQQYTDAYGDLMEKTVSSMSFTFDELVQYVIALDHRTPPIDIYGRRYDNMSSSGVNITSELSGEIIARYPSDSEVASECMRFCNKMIYEKVLYATRADETVIVAESYTSYARGGNNDVIDAANLLDVTGKLWILNDAWKDLTVTNKNLDNAIPDKFLTAIREMRRDASPRDFLHITYEYKQAYPSVIPRYIDADNIRSYPFVHARSINYSEIKLIDRYTDDERQEKKEKTKAEQLIDDAMAAIAQKTTELSKSYIKKAHNGDWNYKKRIKVKSKNLHYTDDDALTHLHTNVYNPRTDRRCLPYGYILNSFKDAIEYLKHEAVNTWCIDKEEAAIFCEAIENGFKWCEKTKIAKWMWHNDGVRYYGTKKGGDDWNGIVNAYHKVGNKTYWFNGKGHIKQWRGKNLEDYDDFKWTDDPYEVEKTKTVTDSTTGEETEEVVTDDDDKPVMVTKHRYRFQDKDGNYLSNCWIEESSTKHYWVGDDGYRVDDDDDHKNTVYKTDSDPWTLIPGKDGTTYRITGYRYGNPDKGIFPKNEQFMYIKENKGWFRFVDSQAGAGTIQGNYLSDASWGWKKYKKGWRYTDGNRSYITWQWCKIDGKWYYFPPGGGYADTTTDDFDENSKSFNTTNKHPEVDYNREGVTSIGTSDVTTETETYDANRDGVQAWIQKGFIKSLKKVILKWHLAIWNQLRESLVAAAENDIKTLRNESLSVEIDFTLLNRYSGYEDLKFLEDLYLGDYVHVRSTLHNFDGDLRVVGMKYDCINNKPISMTLGYPANSFIKRNAQQNSAGIVKFYSPMEYIEDGYGDYIEDGTIIQPDIPAR